MKYFMLMLWWDEKFPVPTHIHFYYHRYVEACVFVLSFSFKRQTLASIKIPRSKKCNVVKGKEFFLNPLRLSVEVKNANWVIKQRSRQSTLHRQLFQTGRREQNHKNCWFCVEKKILRFSKFPKQLKQIFQSRTSSKNPIRVLYEENL